MKEKSFTEKAQLEIEVEEQERIEAARIAKEKRLISQAKQLIKQKNDLLKQIDEIDEKLEKINKGEEVYYCSFIYPIINSNFNIVSQCFEKSLMLSANIKC